MKHLDGIRLSENVTVKQTHCYSCINSGSLRDNCCPFLVLWAHGAQLRQANVIC